MTGLHPREARFAPRTEASSRTLALVLAAVGVLGACGRDLPLDPRAAPDGPSRSLNPACAGTGGLVHPGGTVSAEEFWDAADNPHRVTGTITVDAGGRLRLRAGVWVCVSPFTAIRAVNGGRLAVEGHDSARVVLTAADPELGWRGIDLTGNPSGSSFLRNARVEHVDELSVAVRATDRHLTLLDSVTIRQSGQATELFSPGSRIVRSWVDTTTNVYSAAVVLGDSTRFERTTVRGAAGRGVVVVAVGGVILAGGRIEGSGDVGLSVFSGNPVSDANPIRVVGGASYGAELTVGVLAKMYRTVESQDSLLGNGRDTLVVWGGTMNVHVYARAELPWHVRGQVQIGAGGQLRPQPGARLALDPTAEIRAENGGRLLARGSAAAPVVLTAADPALGWGGMRLSGAPTGPSYLTNVRVEHTNWLAVHGGGTHRVVIDSAVFRQTAYAIDLFAPDSRVSRTRVDTTLIAELYAVGLGANAKLESTLIRGSAGQGLVLWSPTVNVVSCEVRESANEGIAVTSGTPVHNCNVVDNGGPGIHNHNASIIDATHVWWGDAAGPTGPSGDGVSGLVFYTPWRTTPVVLPYVP